jgi:hypothetical protein
MVPEENSGQASVADETLPGTAKRTHQLEATSMSAWELAITVAASGAFLLLAGSYLLNRRP